MELLLTISNALVNSKIYEVVLIARALLLSQEDFLWNDEYIVFFLRTKIKHNMSVILLGVGVLSIRYTEAPVKKNLTQ